MSKSQIRWIALALGLTVLALAGIAQAEVAQKGTIRVQFDGQLTPNKLPRSAARRSRSRSRPRSPRPTPKRRPRR